MSPVFFSPPIRRVAAFLVIAVCCSGLFAVAHAQTRAAAGAPSFSHRFTIETPGGALRHRATLPDTVRILAVMVEFQSDAETRTSGTGKFGTVFPYDYGADIIDPYPYDHAYFRAHLRFLENYIRKASGGKTLARGTVLDSVVTVSKPIRDYTFLKNQSEKPVADLAVEAWTLAERANPGTDFSQYDMFVIFHAGRGRDIDMAALQGSDPTPFDIPSLSFTLRSFRKFYGADYAGIPVNTGRVHIDNSCIIPCTDSREVQTITGQTALLELSINGLLAASFGTYAGLPDLFNTARGTTGIGRFGLMDPEAFFAFGGICPPAPSAWEKQFLGWTIPREAAAGRHPYLLSAYRTDQPSTADIIKVPITGSEYWLLENRQRDPGNNGQSVTMISGGQEITQRFPKDTTGFTSDNVTLLKGVIVDVEDLDWSLPGGTVSTGTRDARVSGGILIWHIDEGIIAAGLDNNTVNANPDLRGVDLEQANGPQDIGKSIPSILGATTGTGSPLDYWFRGNISPLYVNSFGPSTTPNTASNSGAFTHVTIENFDVSGPVMSLDIALGDNTIAPASGFPVDLRPALSSEQRARQVQTFDLDGDGAHELLVAASHPAAPSAGSGADTTLLFAYRADGTPFLGGAAAPAPVAVLAGLHALSGAPMIGDVTGDGVADIVIPATDAAGSAVFTIFAPRDADNDGHFDEEGRIVVPATGVPVTDASWYMIHAGSLAYVTAAAGQSGFDTLHLRGAATRDIPVPAGIQRLAGTDDPDVLFAGAFIRLSTGQLLPSRTVSSTGATEATGRNCVSADMTGDKVSDGAILLRSLITKDRMGPAGSMGMPNTIGVVSFSPQLAAADVDGDGRNDLVVADSSRVAVFNSVSAATEYYPTSVGARAVLAARFNGESRDALFAVGNGQLSQLVTRARLADGFPVPISDDASVVLFPLGSGTPMLGIAVAGSDGRLWVYRMTESLAPDGLVWRSIYGDERNTNAARASVNPVVTASTFFPLERCYNWPNPVYGTMTKIRFYVANDAGITVKIYDLAGDRVAELHGRGLGGFDNEIDWDVSGIQSGVYMAHVKAEGANQSGEKIVRIAVVK